MKKRIKKAAACMLIAICVVILLAVTSAAWLIEGPFYLVAGWYFYIKHTLRGITWSWEAVATGLMLLVLSLAAFHLLVRSIAATRGRRWLWKWSILFVAMTVVIFGVSLAAGGIAHQAIWLAHTEKWLGGRRTITKQFSKAIQLRHAVGFYAKDHGGAFPRNIGDMIESDVLDLEVLEDLAFSWPPYEPPTAWIYVRGLSESAPEDLPLFISPRAFPGNKLMIVPNGSGAELMSEEMIRERLPRWKSAYAALGVPLPAVLQKYDQQEPATTRPAK